MKCIAKKIFLFIICLLFFQNVNAFDINTRFTRYGAGFMGHNSIYYGGEVYNTYAYYVTGPETYAAYCLDPKIAAFNDMKVSRILLEDESLKAKDFGMLHILKNGVSRYENPLATARYEATSFALRMYVNGFLGWARNSSLSYGVTQAYVGTIYDIVKNDSRLQTAYNTLTGKDYSYILTQYGMSTSNYIKFTGSGTGASVLSSAKTLITNAILEAEKYQKGEVQIPKVKATTAVNLKTDDGDNTKLVVVKFEFKNAPQNFQFVGAINQKNIASIQPLGYSYEYSTDPSKFNTSSDPIDTSKEAVYYAYKVKYISSDIDEDTEASFDVKYKVNDSRILTGAILTPVNDSYVQGQRFAIYDNKLEDVVHVVLKPTGCEPDFNMPTICSDDTTDIDTTSNTATYSFKEGVKDGNEQITKCIVNKNDAGGNSLKLVDNEYAAIVSNNAYCAVYCKENYEFTVPYKKQVENGRYFTIGMEIKGQQDCYLSQINTSKYNDDIIQAQIDIINNYNEWLKYYELVHGKENGRWQKDSSTSSCTKRTCTEYTPEATNNNPNPSATCISGSHTSATRDKYHINLKGTYYAYSRNGDSLNVYVGGKPTVSDIYGKVKENSIEYCSASCKVAGYSSCSFVTPDDDYRENYLPGYESNLSSSREALLNSIEKLKQIVDEYNGCMADHSYSPQSSSFNNVYWDMIYDFSPEIKYSYNEPEPNNVDSPKWIDEVKTKSCGGKTCDVMKTIEERIQAEKCKEGSTTCTTTSQVELLFDGGISPVTEYCAAGNLDVNTYACSNPQSSVSYVDRSYWNCDLKGDTFNCYQHSYKVTNLAYVHKVATAQGKYDTERVYYSHHVDGSIKIFAGNETVENNYDIVKGLPVGINTPIDTYFYILSIDKIGKYYSTGQLGRIYGKNSTSLSSVLKDVGKTTINNDDLKGNDYACTYIVSQTTCTFNGVTHMIPEECNANESVDECQLRLCPVKKCVKSAEAYYACESENSSLDSCTAYGNDREAALAAVGCQVGEPCENNYNCCPNCTVLCIGKCTWIFDTSNGANLLLNFKSITPAGVNINDRKMGYNWDVTNASNVLVAGKAKNTISEIETRANLSSIENVSDDTLKEVNSYDFKVKLTPSVAKKVREYNKEHESDGSYNNETMYCYDYTIDKPGSFENKDKCEKAGYTWKDNKCVMENIFCYSKFIDEMIAWNLGAVEEQIVTKRATAKANASYNYDFVTYRNLPNLPDKSASIVANDYWTIYIYDRLDVNGDGIPDIGPSWK